MVRIAKLFCHIISQTNSVGKQMAEIKRALYTRMTNDGVDAWLDKEK